MLHKRIANISMFFLLILPTLLPASFISASIIIVIFLIGFNPLGNKINFGFIQFVLPLVLIAFIGSHGFFSHDLYNIFKDLWYILNPVATLIAGYFLMIYIDEIKSVLKLIIIAAVIMATLHIAQFIFNTDLIYQNYLDIRRVAGHGYFIVTMGLSILLICWRKFPFENPIKNKLIFSLTFGLLSISLVLSFSRTFLLCFLLQVFALWGLFSKNNKNQMKYIILLALFLVFSFLMDSNLSKFSYANEGTFISKLLSSWNEITITNYSSFSDINTNWRGYESYRGLQAYSSGNYFNIIAGKGIGYLTDIGISIKLGEDSYFRLIPIFHNGYIYLLIKTGIVGLLLYLFFFFKTFLFANSIDSNDNLIDLSTRITIGILMVLLATTVLISGYFNKSVMTPAILILGACLSYLYNQKKIIRDALSEEKISRIQY